MSVVLPPHCSYTVTVLLMCVLPMLCGFSDSVRYVEQNNCAHVPVVIQRLMHALDRSDADAGGGATTS